MDLFRIDPGLILWTWITFGVLLFLLGKFVFPPLMNSIRTREEKIRQSVDRANQIEQRLAEIEQEHAATVKRSRDEADEILRRAREDAEAVRSRLLEKADREVQEIYAQARARIAEERAAAVESIRQEIAELVCETSEKVIGRSFTTEEDRDWARELVETL